ncbi:ATG12/APG12 putative (ATG12) [Leptomonas seymouri]|uniref:Autophagy-related protein n=1 Tax=Leptomonas seymouri TaxID=5684 RepID=A0A0N1IHE2_LEPSE|nr:ATG12/APG12 putative (ATG12) [Leptomonas seymouri]|eukprot:KPI82942.1 ATG12/APG12 putative (ATG12) [Leptomonas seymouri]
MEARYNTAADASASRAPILPTPCSPGCPTVSFCSSSGSSEQYVSPRNGEHGGEPAEGLPLQCDPAMAKNSTSCRERQRSRREVGIKMQPSESHARLQQHSFDPLDQHASSDPTATATQRQDYSNSTSCPLASSSHVTSPPSPSPPPPPPPRTHYQYIHSFDYRCRLAAKMRALYGTQSIPIIVEPAESHLRTPSPPARPYEPRSVIAEAPMHSTGIGGGLLARLGLQGTSAQSSSAKAASSLSLSSSTASALASPSTRSTLKCVLPYSKTVAEVILTLRDRLALDSCQSLFLSVGENNALVPGNAFLGDLYQRYHHRDGFLYLSYLLENTFG